MNEDDFKTVEKYYPICYQAVINQATSKMTINMKDELFALLKREGRAAGVCPKCGSGVLEIAVRACQLYNENKDKFNNNEDAETKEQKAKRGRTRKSV